MDGYALVNALLQKKSKTFEDYALLEVLPTVETYSSKSRRTAAEGRRALLIKANDTDILVIAVSTLPVLQELGLEKLYSSPWPLHLQWVQKRLGGCYSSMLLAAAMWCQTGFFLWSYSMNVCQWHVTTNGGTVTLWGEIIDFLGAATSEINLLILK